MIVLDASALLAFLFGEPGYDRVRAALPEALMSAVNWCEVLTRLADPENAGARAWVQRAPLPVVEFSARQAELAAGLSLAGRPLGLSLADRACLALARERGIPAMTADRAWRGLEVEIAIEVIR